MCTVEAGINLDLKYNEDTIPIKERRNNELLLTMKLPESITDTYDIEEDRLLHLKEFVEKKSAE
jgi:hypothetical protein